MSTLLENSQKYIHCGHWCWRLWVCVCCPSIRQKTCSLMWMSLLTSCALSESHAPTWSWVGLVCRIAGECSPSDATDAASLGGSEQHVLVVNRPFATSLRLQLIVRVPLRDVGGRVAEEGSPSYRFTSTQSSGGRRREVGDGVGASDGVVPCLGSRGGVGAGGGGGGGGAGGMGLTGAASQAAVS